jgi:plasmid replication initiation protein
MEKELSPLEKLKQDKQEIAPIQSNKAKIHNNFIETYIFKNNLIAIKILFYVAQSNFNKINLKEKITTIKIDTKALCDYCQIDFKTLKRQIFKELMMTSIFTINTIDEIEKTVLIPRAKFLTNRHILEIDIYNVILNMLILVKDRYTIIDTKNFMKLNSKNSLRMIHILEYIDGFGKDIAKRKKYDLDEINGVFGTNYKNCYEFERKVLMPIRQELDTKSKLTFQYETIYKQTPKGKKGRPKAIGFTIDLLDNKQRQPLLF